MLNSVVSIASKQLRACLFNERCHFRALGAAYNSVVCGNEKFKSAVVVQQQTRWLRTSCCLMRDTRVRVEVKRDEGIPGVKSLDTDRSLKMNSALFPDENTPDMLVDGVKFSDLSVINIKVTKNNTILNVTDSKGKPLFSNSCGNEGFKNAKKGTNVAAQAAGIALGMKSLSLGVRNVRVRIRGLGPGRAASLKGLQMAGMNIVSITDNTPAEITGPRPRKVRRV